MFEICLELFLGMFKGLFSLLFMALGFGASFIAAAAIPLLLVIFVDKQYNAHPKFFHWVNANKMIVLGKWFILVFVIVWPTIFGVAMTSKMTQAFIIPSLWTDKPENHPVVKVKSEIRTYKIISTTPPKGVYVTLLDVKTGVQYQPWYLGSLCISSKPIKAGDFLNVIVTHNKQGTREFITFNDITSVACPGGTS